MHMSFFYVHQRPLFLAVLTGECLHKKMEGVSTFRE